MFKDLAHKSLVLMLVAGFSGVLLSVTYSITAPYIEKSRVEARLIAEQEVGGNPYEVIAKGYAGDISMLVGIGDDDRVTGVKVLSMLETPGLGALASSPKKLKGYPFSFMGQFKGKTIADKLRAKKEIVAITGATITSQAIADGVGMALKQAQPQ